MTKSNMKLTPYEDIFSSEVSRQDDKRERVMELSLTQLQPFKKHPFHTKQDEELQKLADSIKEYGILTPLIARPCDNGYELISGHRRKAAAELAGIGTLPVLIREMADDAAIILMVDSNIQRENLLPSEKAFAYKMKLEAMKRQGTRTDLTSGQVVQKLKTSVEVVAGEAGENYKQIQRYIRLTELIPELFVFMALTSFVYILS